MKILVIYYSFEGNTRFIAQEIAQGLGADILELKPKYELKAHGFMKYVLGGRQVCFGKRPELLPLEKQPEEYDLLFIGTPIWAWNYTPPLNTFFSQVKLKNKKIALFCCCKSQPGKTLETMEQRLKGNEIIGEKVFFQPADEGIKEKVKEEAREWARGAVKQAQGI